MVIVSGTDRPELISSLTKILMGHNAEIIDIEQASLQNLMSLYFLP
jgi:predicted amino acid-binding ACT domain protein